VLLVPSRGPDGTAWTLVAARSVPVHVGGRPLSLGLRVLADRDEIRVEGAGTVFFSTEVLPRVEPFPIRDRQLFCGRCKDPLVPEKPAVRCPDCGVWHHQCERRGCWTYAEKCAMCDRATALDQGFRWTPEDA
jgi:hypothetical protein